MLGGLERGPRPSIRTLLISLGASVLLVASPLAPTAVSAAEPTGQVAQWLFDETSGSVAADETGNGHTGGVTGATFVTGHDGNALSFANPGDRVTVPDSAAFEVTHFTITAWVKASESPGVDRVIVAKGADDCGTYSYALTTGPNGGLTGVVFDALSGSVQTSDIAPASIWDGSWHFVALVNHGPAVSLVVQIDAIPMAQNTTFLQPPSFGLAVDTLTIGGPPAACASGGDFVGLVDDVRFYPTALGDLSGFVPPIPTTITIDPLPATSTICAAPAVTALVSPAPRAGGSVTFSVDHGDGPINLGGAALDNFTGTVVGPSAYSTIGQNTYRATFENGRQFQDSTSAPVSMTVTTCPSTTQALALANPVAVGTVVNLRAIVAPADEGTVDFYDVTDTGDTLIAADRVVDYTGTAYFNGFFSAGDHTIRADYSGGPRDDPSSGQFILTVNQTTSGANAAATPEPSIQGHPITLQLGMQTIPDGGTVTFTDVTGGGSTVLGSAQVSTTWNYTDLVIAALPVGIRSIRADYSGTAQFAPATVTFNHTTLADSTVSASGVGVAHATFYPYKDGYLDTVAIRGTRAEPLSVAIRIYSPAGKVVRTQSYGRAGGPYTFTWNGRSSSGATLASAKYKVVQTLTDAYGNHRAFTSYVTTSSKRLYFSTKTITKTGTGYSAKFADLPSGAGYGYAFTLPSATMYKAISVKIQGKSTVPPASFGAQDYTACSATSAWVSRCFAILGNLPPSLGWVSRSATASRYHHGHSLRVGVFAGYGSKATIYKVQIVVTYGILR